MQRLQNHSPSLETEKLFVWNIRHPVPQGLLSPYFPASTRRGFPDSIDFRPATRASAQIIESGDLQAMIPVLVLGDSHASVFSSEKIAALLPGYSFEVTSVGGATVSGLQNPNAVTQAMPQFTSALEKTTATTVIVMLGEVDTGFVIWYRAQKYGTPVNQMLQLALDNYQKLLKDIARTHEVICISTPLPTIRDGMDWGEVANLRKDVTASLAERTLLTIKFNDLMESFCIPEGISYLNFDSHSTDDSGNLTESLRNPDPSDHHYDPSAHALMIEPLLAPLLQRLHFHPDGYRAQSVAKQTVRERLLNFIQRWK